MTKRSRKYFAQKKEVRRWAEGCYICGSRSDNYECETCQEIVCFNHMVHSTVHREVTECLCKSCDPWNR